MNIGGAYQIESINMSYTTIYRNKTPKSKNTIFWPKNFFFDNLISPTELGL